MSRETEPKAVPEDKTKPKYCIVYSTFYQESKRRAWDTNALVLAQHLLTNEHRLQEGIYRLPISYILEDLPGGWTRARLKRAFEALARDGFALYDEDSGVVFLPNGLKWNPPKGCDQITGAVRKLRSLPETMLWAEYLKAAEEYAPDFAAALRDEFRERLAWGENAARTPSLRGSCRDSPTESLTPQALDSCSISDSPSCSEVHSSVTDSQSPGSSSDTETPAQELDNREDPSASLSPFGSPSSSPLPSIEEDEGTESPTATSLDLKEQVVVEGQHLRADEAANTAREVDCDPELSSLWERFLTGLASNDELGDLHARLVYECSPPTRDGDRYVVDVYASTFGELERHKAAIRSLTAEAFGHPDALHFEHPASLSEHGLTVQHQGENDDHGLFEDCPCDAEVYR